MARYTESVCRLCRRERTKLFLKGTKCETDKCPIERRAYPPGEHGRDRRPGKESNYGTQLREKQKARRIYGVLERQFRNTYQKANRMPGVTGDNLLSMMESRLDNVVYRMNLAPSRASARQLVRHGHILVDGRRVDIPSCLVAPDQVVSVKEASRQMPLILDALERRGSRPVPEWLEIDAEAMSGRVRMKPTREDIQIPVQEQLIIELYSK
ncbi:MAG: 30S ribosomal protein S4 [Candidatus Eiseniibacteriota bacterium]|jgi:small subunit ribosomal protein S4